MAKIQSKYLKALNEILEIFAKLTISVEKESVADEDPELVLAELSLITKDCLDELLEDDFTPEDVANLITAITTALDEIEPGIFDSIELEDEEDENDDDLEIDEDYDEYEDDDDYDDDDF